jgi:hypothetical protein
MSDLIRHARAGLTRLRAGDGVISSTRPPGSELLSLDIDFASCRAAILGGAASGSAKETSLSFIFFSYCISYCIVYESTIVICAASRSKKEPQPANVDKRKR